MTPFSRTVTALFAIEVLSPLIVDTNDYFTDIFTETSKKQMHELEFVAS